MRCLLQFQNISKAYQTKVLMNEATVSINEGQHIGVIGINGAGKSTMLQIMAKVMEPDAGVVTYSKDLRLSYLRQETLFSDQTTVEYIMSANIPEWDAFKLGDDFQLSQEQMKMKITELSGGYRMRAKLAHLLASKPNLLLLDEPTNYLDLETTLLLEKFLQTYQGSYLLISHDREFLRRTCDHTLEIELGKISIFPGDVDEYEEMKALWISQQEAQAKNIEKKAQALETFISRFKAKASKATQAQSKMKQLQKLEKITVDKVATSLERLKIPPPKHSGKTSIKISDASMGYGNTRILQDINLEIYRGDHIAVVGNNGEGKTTFLKTIASALDLQEGKIDFGHQVFLSYYAQHVPEALNPKLSVLESLHEAAGSEVSDLEIRSLAGSLLFSGDEADKKISVLSGGEKARVALGRVLLSRAPVLLLDEPSNHLDIQSSESLAIALQKFEGTCIVVSHDRTFLTQFTSKVFEVKKGKVEIFPGTYEEYVWKLTQKTFNLESQPSSSTTTTSSSDNFEKNTYEERKEIKAKIRKCERAIEEEEKTQNQLKVQRDLLNKKLAENYNHTDYKEFEAITRRLERSELLWLEAHEELEKLKTTV